MQWMVATDDRLWPLRSGEKMGTFDAKSPRESI